MVGSLYQHLLALAFSLKEARARMGPLITTETAEGPSFEDWGLGPQGQIGEHTRKLGSEPA